MNNAIIIATAIFDLARRAAIHLDQQEAPQRQLARQKKKDDENRLQLEMAWQVNKAYIRP